MIRRFKSVIAAGILFLAVSSLVDSSVDGAVKEVSADICVYGATPSGILAAVAVARGNRTAVIVEPSRWVGGILGAGLKPTQDCPNILATGGLTRQLLDTLGQPVVEKDGKAVRVKVDNAELTPHDIRLDFLDLLQRHSINVIYDHRVSGCVKEGPAIRVAVFDRAPFDALGCPVAQPAQRNSLRIRARVFIDATYDADLLARAGVSYRVGRESGDEFGEELGGVRPPSEVTPVDPFVVPGDPASGLLPMVEDDYGKATGAADDYTQAYNYRYYTTGDEEHRIELTPPANYDSREYELVGRYVQHLVDTTEAPEQLVDRLSRIFPGWRNSGVWNYHRDSLFSLAPVGVSQLYADGDYATKARIWKLHQDYLRGLHHFMSTDLRVPEQFRKKTAAIGLDGRHHIDTRGWPHQLYIRVSRRLKGRYTITAHDVYNRTSVDDPIGLAQYGIDTYPSRRIWFRRGGQIYVGIEGKMFIGSARGPTNVPYPIPYRAITPAAGECTNLLVPVCFSATHLGYASARMEPVFMICGQSAGIAACQALAQETTVQGIDPIVYRQTLECAGQLLEWTEELARLADSQSRSSTEYSFGRLARECDKDENKLVSQSEWNAGKAGWEWLFAIIDRNQDGSIDAPEYRGFQALKKSNPRWQELRSKGHD